MTVVSVDTDYDNLAVTVIADFVAPVERVWELWTDPRTLGRWWGPPSYPATFTIHNLVPGGEARYFMTSREGKQYAGVWRVIAVQPPVWLQFDDVFTGADGEPNNDRPVTRVSIKLSEHQGGTRMVMRSTLETREDLESWLNTGTREGLEDAVAQMDGLLHA